MPVIHSPSPASASKPPSRNVASHAPPSAGSGPRDLRRARRALDAAARRRSPTRATACAGILGHSVGWPFARGGSQAHRRRRSRRTCARSAARSNRPNVTRSASCDGARCRPARRHAASARPARGRALPARYRGGSSGYRYGPGVFKLDWALDGPIPWQAPDALARRRFISAGRSTRSPRSERRHKAATNRGAPYVLSPSRACSTRRARRTGKHTGWAYCHVPNGSPVDMTERIESQIERFAPGSGTASSPATPWGPPTWSPTTPTTSAATSTAAPGPPPALHPPRRAPLALHDAGRRLYICSASTPPGGGVHGMCGYHAAKAALRYLEVRR